MFHFLRVRKKTLKHDINHIILSSAQGVSFTYKKIYELRSLFFYFLPPFSYLPFLFYASKNGANCHSHPTLGTIKIQVGLFIKQQEKEAFTSYVVKKRPSYAPCKRFIFIFRQNTHSTNRYLIKSAYFMFLSFFRFLLFFALCSLLFVLCSLFFVLCSLLFVRFISPSLYLLWCSMNLHFVTIFTSLRFSLRYDLFNFFY